MRRSLAIIVLLSLVTAICTPQSVLAQEEAEETESVPQTAESEEPAVIEALGAGSSEPAEPAYGIESLLPQLANPNDPTLSAELAQQTLVNLFQGAAEFNMPLALPPGINGHTPQADLSYSSHQARRNGPVGFGWQLELGTIRRMLRGPATTLYTSPSYYLALPDLQGELTHLSTDGDIETYALRRDPPMQNHSTTTEENQIQEQDYRPILFSANKLAAILNISTRTLWRLRSASKLPKPVRFGGNVRWRAEEVQAWIDAGCPSIVD